MCVCKSVVFTVNPTGYTHTIHPYILIFNIVKCRDTLSSTTIALNTWTQVLPYQTFRCTVQYSAKGVFSVYYFCNVCVNISFWMQLYVNIISKVVVQYCTAQVPLCEYHKHAIGMGIIIIIIIA